MNEPSVKLKSNDDYDTWFIAEVEKGLKQVETDQTLRHEEVGIRIEKYIATQQQR